MYSKYGYLGRMLGMKEEYIYIYILRLKILTSLWPGGRGALPLRR